MEYTKGDKFNKETPLELLGSMQWEAGGGTGWGLMKYC